MTVLLRFGDARPVPTWPDCPTRYGLTLADAPELVRLATDPALLARPRGAAVGPLLPLLRRVVDDEDDWVGEELPEVFGRIGRAAVDPLRDFLADPANRTYARVAAAVGLREVRKRHPDARDVVAAALAAELARFDPAEPSVNGFVVSGLLDLKAVEHAGVVREAYAKGCVDPEICGDWAEVQYEFGLKVRPKRLRPGTRVLLADAVSGVIRPPFGR
ncbi:MAG: hypothetical protein JWO31_3407 [Phycisphaerales bacterium]|nr:hypothetical protein [Phycisphaerales bacterium]